jgi:prevent-host-death family protein
MENKVGIRELKQNPSAVIARVKAGEDITVTERGEPVAKITSQQKSILDQLSDAGDLSIARGNLADFLKNSSATRVAQGTPSSEQMLTQTRGERL